MDTGRVHLPLNHEGNPNNKNFKFITGYLVAHENIVNGAFFISNHFGIFFPLGITVNLKRVGELGVACFFTLGIQYT